MKIFNRFLLGSALLGITFGQSVCGFSEEGSATMFVKTSSTFGWEVLNDKPPVSTLELADGPKGKVLALKFQFEEGLWIAVVKAVSLSLKEEDGIRFQFKGNGGGANLLVKVADSAGAVAGYTVAGGMLSEAWKTVVAPRAEFKYLYGGSSNQIQWNNIVKLEITLDSPQTKNVPGELVISGFESGDAKMLSQSEKHGKASAGKVHKKK